MFREYKENYGESRLMININVLGKQEAVVIWNNYQENGWVLPELSGSYLSLRNDLVSIFNSVLEKGLKLKNYDFDAVFAIALYKLFDKLELSNLRTVSNDGFWRYLSLIVIPDLVKARWEKDDSISSGFADHFFRRPNRIWLKSLWWYVYLSFNENLDTTRGILLSGHFSTDTILNLVERSGRTGTNIELFRAIMRIYCKEAVCSEKNFQRIMKLNTVKSQVIEPMLVVGGVDAYVRGIINELGIRKDEEQE